jgi:hypothetical protein
MGRQALLRRRGPCFREPAGKEIPGRKVRTMPFVPRIRELRFRIRHRKSLLGTQSFKLWLETMAEGRLPWRDAVILELGLRTGVRELRSTRNEMSWVWLLRTNSERGLDSLELMVPNAPVPGIAVSGVLVTIAQNCVRISEIRMRSRLNASRRNCRNGFSMK